MMSADDENGGDSKVNNSRVKPTLFVDEKNNLKFVNIVVRYPCCMFLVVITVCLTITILLSNTVFAQGYPFTEDTNTYDLYDKRAVAYDSFRLAKEKVSSIAKENKINQIVDEKDANVTTFQQKRVQEDIGDVIYWIYESKTDEGLIGSKESIGIMRQAETMITKYEQYPKYCWKKYTVIGNETKSSCRKPLSILNIFYASSWNSSKAKNIVSELTPDNIRMYNILAPCVEYNIFCQYIPVFMIKQVEWANKLNEEIKSVMSQWDGEGNLNENIEEVTSFLAHINELITKSPQINFFFDSNFTLENRKTMFSRSILYWGAPLEGFDSDDQKSSDSRGGGRSKSKLQDEARKKYV